MKHCLSDDQQVAVADCPWSRTSINDVLLLHLLSCFGSLVLVDPIRLVPVVMGNNTKFDLGVGHHTDTPGKGGHARDVGPSLAGCDGVNTLFEILCELDLVEEDPRIMILVIESILELPDALDRSIDLFVPTKHQKDGVGLSELGVEGSDVDIYDLCGIVVLVLGAEKIGDGGFLAVGFVGEGEDGMEAELREERRGEG